MFKEITGLSIGYVYIDKHLAKYSKRDFFSKFRNSRMESFFNANTYRQFLEKNSKDVEK